MNRRFTISSFLAVAVFAMFSVGNPTHGAFEISIGGDELTGSGAGSINPDAIHLTFENNGIDKVRLTIAANEDASKVKDVLFNIDPSVGTPTFTYVSDVQATATNFGQNSFGLGGPLNGFDIEFQFDTSGPTGDLFDGEQSVYDIMATGLTENSFNFLNDQNDTYLAASHINQPADFGDSGKYGGTPPPDEVIPEPASVAIWFAFVGLGVAISRSRRRLSHR